MTAVTGTKRVSKKALYQIMIQYVGDYEAARRFVISTNAHRRDLTPQQRAMSVAKIANLQGGRPKETNSRDSVSNEEAARLSGVGRESVVRAKVVSKSGTEELQQLVTEKNLSLKLAAEIARKAPEEQRELLKEVDPTDIKKASKEIRTKEAKAKKLEQFAKLQEISQNNQQLETDKKYSVIYADPPWKYDFSSTVNRSLDNQYPQMELSDICNMPVPDISHDDCILFLWTTSPKLEESFKVMHSWGFTYKTSAVWTKDKIGMGYYFRQQHEILLVGTKGNIPTPLPEDRPPSIIQHPTGKHSQKPSKIYELLETMYKGVSKIELFCRNPREGWDAWGNQAIP